MRTILMIAAGALATPAMAQMNPAAIGQGLVMPSAINAQAKHAAHGTTARGHSPQNARDCAQVPEYRKQYPGDPRVDRLAGMCRDLGYDTGE